MSKTISNPTPTKEEVLNAINEIESNKKFFYLLQFLSSNFDVIKELKAEYIKDQNYESAAKLRTFERIFNSLCLNDKIAQIEDHNKKFSKEDIFSIICECTKYNNKVDLPAASKYSGNKLQLNIETIGILQFLNLLEKFKSEK